MSEILDIVNRDDEIIGRAKRDVAHENGLVFRMVYVLFYTPTKQLILQRRSLSKKINPGKLTTTVSGHVESGSTYLETAVKETLEETGVNISASNLVSLGTIYAEYTEGKYISNSIREMFIYKYEGDVKDLTIEAGEGIGFEVVTISEFWDYRNNTPNILAKHMLDKVGEIMVGYIDNL